MSVMQRRKGKAAELEICRLLSDHFGDIVVRNISPCRDGGADVLGFGRWAIEVKRQERLAIAVWWRQACEQAEIHAMIPVLAYRQSHQPWRFVVPLAVLMGEPIDSQAVAALDLDGFCAVVRGVRG